MKFTDGYWRTRKTLQLYQAVKAVDYTLGDNEFTVYAGTCPDANIRDIGGVFLTVRLYSPAEDIIGVDIRHHIGRLENFSRFVDEKAHTGAASMENGVLRLTSGKTRASLDINANWNLTFTYDGRFLTRSGWRSVGYIVDSGGAAFIKDELSLGVGENVYGLGELFTNFVKNGQVVNIWNADGGTSSELAYKSVPFYLTSRGYGVLINDSGKVSLEVASEKVERVQFSVPGEHLSYFVIGGNGPRDVLTNYTGLTGRPALPPPWSFGLWLSTSFTTDYQEATVTSFIDGMTERDIPLQVFHFDCFWMKGNHWCNFQWDEDAFPEPEKMLARLKERGLKICVWINPYIAQRSQLFVEGMDCGYLLRRTDGGVWQTDDWQAGMGIVDFTNPEARLWYQRVLKRLLDMGVDTFKTDFGERIPVDNVEYFNGHDPSRMHNYYTLLYNQTVFELLQAERGDGNALVFARSATVGGQKYPVHWGGDCTASYESMAESLRGGLSLTTCAFGFWSHDISGFENTATPDLYKRWTAFGMFSTHSRLHGNASYRVPWLFDEESTDVLRFFSQTKCRLMPYLFSEATRTHRTGVPMMRALFIDWPGDPTALFIDRQYMLGDSMLVAPVFSEDGEVEYYLPGDGWTGFFDGQERTGGWRRENHSYFSLPVMVKRNAIIPLSDESRLSEYDYLENLCFYWYGMTHGKDARCEVFAPDGQTSGSLDAKWSGSTLSLTSCGLHGAWRVCLVNYDYDLSGAPIVTGGQCGMGERGLTITPSQGATEVSLIF